MPVFWTIQAQHHLRNALAEALGRESHEGVTRTGRGGGVLEATLEHLNELLALTFPGASVVVKDQVDLWDGLAIRPTVNLRLPVAPF